MDYVKLMRPKHYIKNILIFIPLLFSGFLFNFKNIYTTLVGFICFSLTASTIYIINDIKDKEKDKLNNTKCHRPIASGKVSIKNGIILIQILLIIITIFCFLFELNLFAISLLLLYFILNVFYSFGAKNVPLVDISILVSGFLIRILFEASLLNITVSNWLYLTIMTISFYLALGKRRNEIVNNGTKARKVLKNYSKEFLDKNMYVFLTITIVFYSLWTTDSNIVKKNNNLLIWTIPIIIITLMRYSMNIENTSEGNPIDVITKDKILIMLGIIYLIIIIIILYVV